MSNEKALIALHNDFISVIPSFNIPSYNLRTPWTVTITKYFHKLGEKKGYKCRSKYANGEHLKLDLVWKKIDGNIVLALEHENIYKLEKIIRTELSKLVDVKSQYKIMMCYPGDEDEVLLGSFQELIVANKYVEEELYLLMMGSQGIDKNLSDPFIRFESYLLNNDGKIVWEYDTGTIPTTRTQPF